MQVYTQKISFLCVCMRIIHITGAPVVVFLLQFVIVNKYLIGGTLRSPC